MDGERPDPEKLLQRIAQENRAPRARLRIFFGFAPGVGKTYKMLEAARELQLQNVDLVIGCVETHGRYDTAALMLGLEVMPKRQLQHQGRTFEELDLDLVLKRRPKLVVVDELAHTNVPGSRHAKRWQDVFELLDAGIDVVTTLNVQHIESLNDVVSQITGVRVRETVPDHVLDRADEVELVDVSPEELLARLRDGKVYLPDAAARARDNFFRRGNLLALRELALRFAMERVDAEVQEFRDRHEVRRSWGTAERIVVCVGPSPASAKLVRAARRMAAGLRASWSAVYVEALGRPPLGDADQQSLDSNLRLVEWLGGEVVRLQGSDVAATLLAYARQKNVSRIVIGKPTHSRLRDLIRGSLLDAVVRGSGEIEVNVISGDEDRLPRPRERGAPVHEPVRALPFVSAVLVVALATVLAFALRSHLPLPDVAMIYMLAISTVAYRFLRGPSVLAALLSVLAFDFFFVPPTFTFSVSDARHLFTFGTMFAAGLLVSDLVVRLRHQERNAVERARHTAALLGLSRELGRQMEGSEVAGVLARHLFHLFDCGVAVFLPDESNLLHVAARVQLDADEQGDRAVVQWCFDHAQPAGRDTDTLPGSRIQCFPLSSGAQPWGVVALRRADDRAGARLDPGLLDSCIRLAVLAIERAELVAEGRRAALAARTEEMRSTLLSAVSHDLRTPLGVITGAATTLRDAPPSLVEPMRKELVETICEESERLERQLGNLLDMTRLSSGMVELKREWVPVDELLGSALGRLEARLAERPVHVDLPVETTLLEVDPVLFEQLLVNLLDNAAKYTPPGSALWLSARSTPHTVEITVADEGPGIASGDEARIFDRFYRGAHAGGGGVGLGLAICKAIAEVHGGSLRVARGPQGGAAFTVGLPRGVNPPTIEAHDG